MSEIKEIYAREVLDSRGNPTVEAEVRTRAGAFGRAIVPSGASTGIYEAAELRDHDKGRYGGRGVLCAVENVNTIIREALCGSDIFKQTAIDALLVQLDGADHKSHLGANALLSVSLACARAAAHELHMPLYRYLGGFSAGMLPMPMMNILNGGAHADNKLDFQEFMIVPFGAETFSEALRMCSEVYHSLSAVLREKGFDTGLGDEGGFAPKLKGTKEALELMTEAVLLAGYEPKRDIKFSIDAAASEFYSEGKYVLSGEHKKLDTDEMIRYYEKLCENYPIYSIEDGLCEEDWDGWRALTEALGQKIYLIGDDLFVTNKTRLRTGLGKGAANGILIKPNQIGTLTEAFDAMAIARRAGYKVIVSHRSGDSEDTFIADMAVAFNADHIKTGAPARSERTAKYNRLLRIEDELGSMASFRCVR